VLSNGKGLCGYEGQLVGKDGTPDCSFSIVFTADMECMIILMSSLTV
jgi:hypothetical protein